MLEQKIRQIQALKRDINRVFSKNNNEQLRTLSDQFRSEWKKIVDEFQDEIKQAELLELNTDDLKLQLWSSLEDLCRETEYEAKVMNLKYPPKPRFRKWKNYDAFVMSGGSLGIKPKVKAYRKELEQELEEKTMKFINKEYKKAYDKNYSDLVKQNQEKLEQILNLTKNGDE